MVEPHRLSIVLGAKNTGVEEDKEDDEPEHCLQKLPSRKVWKKREIKSETKLKTNISRNCNLGFAKRFNPTWDFLNLKLKI